MKTNVFRHLWIVPKYEGIDTSDLHSYPPKMLIPGACSSRVLNSHDSSIVPTKLFDTTLLVTLPLFFLSLIPDRRVNEIDAVGAGQVNYARFPPRSPQGPLTVDR